MKINMRWLLVGFLGICFIIMGCSVGHTIPEDSYLVINILEKKFYKDCHIVGSINIPFDMIAAFVKKIDKRTPIVLYCSNYMCSASEVALDQLKEMDFVDVRAYEGGMAEWYQLGLPTVGPALLGYLTEEHERPVEYRDDENHITAETLYKYMVENNLL